MRHGILISLIALIIGAGNAVAGLSPEHEKWRAGPVQFLMTADEAARWKTIQTDAAADAFIALFWARRDPTPATPENEFKETFDARVRFADLYYTHGSTAGSLTPRGKAIVLLGAPYSVRRQADAIGPDISVPVISPGPTAARPDADSRNSSSGSSSPSGKSISAVSGADDDAADQPAPGHVTGLMGGTAQSETWVYEHDRTLNFSPQKSVTLVFVDGENIGDYSLGRSPDTNPAAIYESAVKAAIVSPDLVSADERRFRTAGATTIPETATMTDGPLRTPALRDLVGRIREATHLPFEGAWLSWDESVTSTGVSFVPVQLYLTGHATLPDRPATFFGTVFDQGGREVASYERPIALEHSGSALVADTSLSLPPGRYSGLFGVAVDDKPLAMARGELEVKGLDGKAPGVSHLILSDDIHPMAAPQQPTDPFSFGGARVVVKGDHAFSQTRELWFFVEIRNPGLDEAGSPRIRMQIDVDGMSGNQPVQLAFPLQDTNVEPLKDAPGHYALGQSIPLVKIPVGDYRMRLQVVDVIRLKTYELESIFSVAPGPSQHF